MGTIWKKEDPPKDRTIIGVWEHKSPMGKYYTSRVCKWVERNKEWESFMPHAKSWIKSDPTWWTELPEEIKQ